MKTQAPPSSGSVASSTIAKRCDPAAAALCPFTSTAAGFPAGLPRTYRGAPIAAAGTASAPLACLDATVVY